MKSWHTRSLLFSSFYGLCSVFAQVLLGKKSLENIWGIRGIEGVGGGSQGVMGKREEGDGEYFKGEFKSARLVSYSLQLRKKDLNSE